MVIKKGRYGHFLACTGYPECKNAKPLNAGGDGEQPAETPPPLPEGYPTVCEKCGQPLVVKKNRQGSWFISCSGYPKCRNAKPFPSGVNCPKEGCGGQIVEKASKRGPFYGCSNYPKCRFIVKGKPVKTPCPVCGREFLVENPALAKDPDAPPLICSTKDCPGPGGINSGS
jgi:DNA topoisomerase-1